MSRANYSVVLLPGDGVGREVSEEAKRVLALVSKHSGTMFEINEIPCGGEYYLAHERDWPEGSEAACEAADLILLGAVGWPSPTGRGPVTMTNGKMAGWSPVIGNRLRLDLFANIRPVKLLEGVKHKVCGSQKQIWEAGQVDMVFLRENTEGLYSGMGGILAPGGVSEVATDTRVITRRASERIIRLAFETAVKRNGAPKDGKRRVTCVVKNNVLDGCRLFAEIFSEIGKEYPQIEQEFAMVDALTQWLITQPDHYDVCVTTNMFGDILTDLAAVLQGGMGMAVGCNVGKTHAMFEPIHGTAPDIAGQEKANPSAMILATAEALKWLGESKSDSVMSKAGQSIEDSVAAVYKSGRFLTADLVDAASAASTSEMTTAILAELETRFV
jgi:isocitrate/isopropylmalate dehydrogenase